MIHNILMFGKGFAPAPHTTDALVLGRKGADLAAMAASGINVPASLVLPVALIDEFLLHPNSFRHWAQANIGDILEQFGVEDATLMAVRLSPVRPDLGMSQTLLGLGQTPAGFLAHAALYGEDFAWRKRREMVTAYADFAKGIGPDVFEEALEELVEASAAEIQLCKTTEYVFATKSGTPFDVDRNTQITDAIASGLAAWSTPRARAFRDLNGFSHISGFAILLQKQVVFDDHATGCTGLTIPAP